MQHVVSALHPYLFFGDNCRQAMEFYQQVFGGNLTMSTFGDGPADAHQDPLANSEEQKASIMHARLEGAVTLLASDNPHLASTADRTTFSLTLEGSDAPRLSAYFEHLSQGGRVTAPLQPQFWGATFGMLTDRYGINWMISITANTSA
jgi:PhnB protein